MLLPFFEIPYGDRLAKNVKKRYVQVIPRSTVSFTSILHLLQHIDRTDDLNIVLCVPGDFGKTNIHMFYLLCRISIAVLVRIFFSNFLIFSVQHWTYVLE